MHPFEGVNNNAHKHDCYSVTLLTSRSTFRHNYVFNTLRNKPETGLATNFDLYFTLNLQIVHFYIIVSTSTMLYPKNK